MAKINRSSARGGMDVMTNLMLAPAVVWMRVPVMLAQSPGPLGVGTEMLKAASEKVMASAEGAAAAQMSLARSAVGFWPGLMAGSTPWALANAAAGKAAVASLRPAAKAVRRNHRRLSAKRG